MKKVKILGRYLKVKNVTNEDRVAFVVLVYLGCLVLKNLFLFL